MHSLSTVVVVVPRREDRHVFRVHFLRFRRSQRLATPLPLVHRTLTQQRVLWSQSSELSPIVSTNVPGAKHQPHSLRASGLVSVSSPDPRASSARRAEIVTN